MKTNGVGGEIWRQNHDKSHGKLKDEIKKVSRIHGCMDSI
jgi:hypothetical protein